MKSKLTIALPIICFLALLVLGAQQQSCGKQPQGTIFNTTALSLSFVDKAPPSTINIGTTFPIYIEAKNLGGYDIDPGTAKFYLTGVGNNLKNLNFVMINQNKITKKTNQQEAGFEIIKFAENAEAAITLNNPFNFTMRVDTCYPYITNTEVTACVGQGDSFCPVAGEKITTGSNSNAPIQITSFTEQTQGNKIFFSFMINNNGTGTVYYSDLDCDKKFGQDSSEIIRQEMKKNYVEIYIDTGNEQDIKCSLQSPSGTQLEGVQGMAPVGKKVTCSKIIGQQTNPAVFKIKLAYKYVDGTSKGITILP